MALFNGLALFRAYSMSSGLSISLSDFLHKRKKRKRKLLVTLSFELVLWSDLAVLTNYACLHLDITLGRLKVSDGCRGSNPGMPCIKQGRS